MDIQINIENAVSSLSYADKKIVSALLTLLDLSQDMNEATIDMKSVTKTLGFSRSMSVDCLKTLCGWGVISTQNRGPMGTHIVVCNALACKRILELCS